MHEVRVAQVEVVAERRADADGEHFVQVRPGQRLVGVDQSRPLLGQHRIGEPVQAVRFERVIVIENHDVIPARHRETGVRRGAHAPVRFRMQHPNAVVGFRQVIQQRADVGSRRAVVHQHEFPVRVRLRANAFDRRAEPVFASVVHGHEDRERRRVSGPPCRGE
jgi:hypothetical protein